MARIAGVNIPDHKHVVIALTSIFGVGRTRAQKICDASGVSHNRKVGELAENELELLNTFNMKELKEKALVNYVNPNLIGNKTLKRTWVKALEKTKKWGFNTFVVGIKNNKKNVLYGQVDVLLKIQEYI